jgi:G3E family GTPase
MDDQPDEKKVPVTIVTGFLGAGKTTLVNYILNENHGKKIAVIENEFGEVSIDDDLVADNMKTRENVVMMDNGCACCTVRGDLIRALSELHEKGPFDAVLVETTGMADPAPVAFSFQKSAVVKMNFNLDAILCLVDAKHIMKHMLEVREQGVNEAVAQVAFADKILVNKIDLVTEEELEGKIQRVGPRFGVTSGL